MNQLENLIHNLETIAASTVDDFINDDLLCASAARVAGEAAEVLRQLQIRSQMKVTEVVTNTPAGEIEVRKITLDRQDEGSNQ